ncbi:MAG: hypothetical protein EA400_11250 [Chromatiaceae bacterium]|nr:MAG: hypothetical protein EA400_11250 [Chromatiaceae bacterium]
MPHLFIALTAHGYGHLAQCAPVVAALQRRRPDLRVTLQGTIDPAFARSRMPAGFRHLSVAADCVLPMDGPLQARWHEGLALYTAFEADYDRHWAAQRARFEQDRPDLVLANIPWLPLDLARAMDIPALALCSLNWYDILAQSPVGAALPAAVAERMRAAYASAATFLRPSPSMPMAWLPNGQDIGPIAVRRRRDPAGLRTRLGLDPDEQPVLMQFGGAGRLTPGSLDELPPRVRLLSPDTGLAARHPRIRLIDAAEVPDALASCAAIITKPGYGTFAEAACHGVPVLYVPRGDWPEEPWLVDWLSTRVPSAALSAAEFAAGAIGERLAELLAAGPAAPLAATGVDEAMERIEVLLASC